MRYSTEPRFVKGYGFLSFTRKTVMDTAKTASKRVVQKTSEATGDLIGNKIADKITSKGKPKEKEIKKNRRNLYSTRKKTTNY